MATQILKSVTNIESGYIIRYNARFWVWKLIIINCSLVTFTNYIQAINCTVCNMYFLIKVWFNIQFVKFHTCFIVTIRNPVTSFNLKFLGCKKLYLNKSQLWINAKMMKILVLFFCKYSNFYRTPIRLWLECMSLTTVFLQDNFVSKCYLPRSDQ